jgi:LCP family protein required for cell wall assembly
MTNYTRVPFRGNRNRRRPNLPGWLIGLIIGAFVLVTFGAAYLVFATVRDFVASWKITNQGAATPVAAATSATVEPNGAGGGDVPLATPPPGATPVPTVAVETWTGTDRVTILVMGIDRRVGEEEKGYLTDSMMVVSLDPVARTGAMLSIPRDLWVDVPGFEPNKINTANRTGDIYEYPGGGPALAVKTVEHNLGVGIDYYVRLDFTAFETFIDAIGGVDVYNETEIDDPNYPNGSYGYEPFYLPAGPHHLNGHDALRYARTRHTAGSDIDRAARQQEVVMAVRERVLSLNMLPRLIAQAPRLYQTLNQSIWTDLSLDQIVSLALVAQGIPRENIKSAVIDFRYVQDGMTADGQQVLIPLRDKIRELRDELFASSAVRAPASLEDEPALIAAEAARLQVLNGAGIEGLAGRTQAWLAQQGLLVAGIGDADRADYPSTVIVDYTGKPYTVGWLKRTFGVTTIISSADSESPYDVIVILGQDWSVPTSTSGVTP